MSLKSKAVVGELEPVAHFLALVCIPVMRNQKKTHVYMYIFNLLPCLLVLVLVHSFEKISCNRKKKKLHKGVQEEQVLFSCPSSHFAFSLKVCNDH